jgi:hypothetical protein
MALSGGTILTIAGATCVLTVESPVANGPRHAFRQVDQYSTKMELTGKSFAQLLGDRESDRHVKIQLQAC